MDERSMQMMMKIMAEEQAKANGPTMTEKLMAGERARDKKRQQIQDEIAKLTQALSSPGISPVDRAKISARITELNRDIADLNDESSNDFWSLSMPDSLSIVGR